MQVLNFNSFHPFVKWLFALCIILASFYVVTMLGLLIAMPFFNLNFTQLIELVNNQLQVSSTAFLKYAQLVQSLSFFVIPGIMLNFLFRNNNGLYFRLNRAPDINIVILILLTILVSSPLIDLTLQWNMQLKFPEFLSGLEQHMIKLEKDAELLMAKLLSTENIGDLAFSIVLIALVPAIGEEFIFRGIFQQLFRDWIKNSHIAILLTAFLFSAFHLQFFGFLPRFLLGVYFGYLFFWYKSIWVPVLAHFINNCMAVLMHYFYAKKEGVPPPDEIGNTLSGDWKFLIPGLLLTTLFLGYTIYYRKTVKN